MNEASRMTIALLVVSLAELTVSIIGLLLSNSSKE
jgi:hypothetical protein